MKIQYLGNVDQKAKEKIVQIVSSAGALSRFPGTVTEVYESRNSYEDNIKYAKNVIGYGHASISEHDYIVVALEDITPIIEQTIIGYRLTSFTVKSRRNVDFRNAGFYIPEFRDVNGNILPNNEELKNTYSKYMQNLFQKYADLVDEQLPIEDCRYILPYSYHSNIIMGCDAREFVYMVGDLLYGKISHIDECRQFGERLAEIMGEHSPYFMTYLENEKNKTYYEDKLGFLDKFECVKNNSVDQSKLLDETHLLNASPDKMDYTIILRALENRYQLSEKDAEELFYNLSNEYDDFGEYSALNANGGSNRLDFNKSRYPGIKAQIMQAIIHSKHQRELEHVTFTYEFPISLAVLTHITRHRMHSLMVPDFAPLWNLENYITPQSISEKHKEDYDNIFAENKLMVEYFKEQCVRDEDLVYFYLSGNACNVQTTMNGRNLEWISRMRCCNKAQWEIRDIVNKMVSDARVYAPLLAEGFGPTCEIEGYCPEGKDSCKNRGVVVKKLTKKDGESK